MLVNQRLSVFKYIMSVICHTNIKDHVVFLQNVTDKLCVISECFLLPLLMIGNKIGISSDYKE